MTYAQQIREKYGDTVEVFAKRFNTLPSTVEGWEAGQTPQEPAMALLTYADKYQLSLHPSVSDEFSKLTVREQVKLLMNNFGDTQQKLFAKRIALSDYNIGNWVRQNTITPIAQRYLYEVAIHPERFQTTPKSYAE